jgi:hypothetical protein
MISKTSRCCSTRWHRHFHRHTAFYVPVPLRVLAVLLLLTFFTTTAPAAEATFTFTVVEIPDIQRGAGLVIVMRSPSGKTWLYDTGTAHPEKLSSDSWFANYNAGRDLIAPRCPNRPCSSPPC